MPTQDTSNALPEIILNWRQHLSYESARNETNVIYLFEWNDKPFYWGIAKDAAFGRRYNVGYRHLIEGALQHGGKLYLASVQNLPSEIGIDVVENQLIVKYEHVMNRRINMNAEELQLNHEGKVPYCIENNLTRQHATEQPDITNHPREGRTIAKGVPFTYLLSDIGLNLVNKDETTTSLSIDDLMTVLEAMHNQFRGESFPLDNSATPIEPREHGLGTLFCEQLNKTRGVAPITSKLISIFCAAGICDHFEGTGTANDSTRYRLIMLPESNADLLTLIDNIPD